MGENKAKEEHRELRRQLEKLARRIERRRAEQRRPMVCVECLKSECECEHRGYN